MSNPSRLSVQTPSPVPARPSLAFDRDEWELVVTLPRWVLLAALAAAPADGRRAAEGVAGIEAIASGLTSGSPLVREVVSAIYAESHQDPPETQADGDVLSVRTLAACRYAALVVSRRANPQDAAAYRDWLLHVANVVTGVADGAAAAVAVAPDWLTRSPDGPRGTVPSRFVYALDGVLRADRP